MKQQKLQDLHCHIRNLHLFHGLDHEKSACLQSQYCFFVTLIANYDLQLLHHLCGEFSARKNISVNQLSRKNMMIIGSRLSEQANLSYFARLPRGHQGVHIRNFQRFQPFLNFCHVCNSLLLILRNGRILIISSYT